MLYTEEVQGFPAQRVITLRCEFFGLAGHYALRLKPFDPSAPTTSAYIKVSIYMFRFFFFFFFALTFDKTNIKPFSDVI